MVDQSRHLSAVPDVIYHADGNIFVVTITDFIYDADVTVLLLLLFSRSVYIFLSSCTTPKDEKICWSENLLEDSLQLGHI